MANFSPFGSIPVPKKGRTVFDESHEVSGTFPLSYLCPVFMTETIPGDSWTVNVFNTTKLETMIAPAMQRVDASLIWMKVEKRLVFRHWKKWYSGGTDGQDSHEKPHIYLWHFASQLQAWILSNRLDDQAKDITATLFGAGSLWQYLGLPCPLLYDSTSGAWEIRSVLSWDIPSSLDDQKSDDSFIDFMPILAYHMLYDQYFIDQTLGQHCFEDSEEGILKVQGDYNPGMTFSGNFVSFGTVSGVDLSEGGEISFADAVRLLFMFKRAWKKEYFTSALPTPQRGPEVTIPFTEDQIAPVTIPNQNVMIRNLEGIRAEFDQDVSYGDHLVVGNSGDTIITDVNEEATLTKIAGRLSRTDGSLQPSEDPIYGTADLSALSPITITAFRSLFKLQHFLEKNNVAGGRYIETILAQWAERVPDFTVQRATHLRSTSLPVQISEVTAQAYSSGVQSQLGDQAGRGKVQGNLGSVHFYTQEPCFVFALYNVVAPPAYAGQGIPRLFQRITRFDEPWRDFQHIGEQVIKTRELYFDFTDVANVSEDFGYQQRFSEFKYMPDRVVGDFVTTHAYWHMARMFPAMPELNADFVTQNLDERIFAVQGARPVTADFYFQAKAKRKLSKFSTPKLT